MNDVIYWTYRAIPKVVYNQIKLLCKTFKCYRLDKCVFILFYQKSNEYQNNQIKLERKQDYNLPARIKKTRKNC